MTYANLLARADAVAQMLIDAGSKMGSFVGLHMERTPELVVGIVGILKAGGVYVPLDPSYPTERLEFIIEVWLWPGRRSGLGAWADAGGRLGSERGPGHNGC